MSKQYTILAADDDKAILDILKTCLSSEGYKVITASDGEKAVEALSTQEPHLIIMDVMMPRCNGIMATMKIREKSNIPILMLSAKAEGSDKVIGLESGADDYLIKPFYQQELLARVKALLRRCYKSEAAGEEKGGKITVGEMTLDTEKKQLVARGEEVHLTATEFKILNLMMNNPERVFSAEEIYQRVWQNQSFAVENTVMVHISRIREKIEINPRKPEYLKVIWGIGYVFEKK